MARQEPRSLNEHVAFDRRIAYVNALLVVALLVTAAAPVGSAIRTPFDVLYPGVGSNFVIAITLLLLGAALWAYWHRGSQLIVLVDGFVFVSPLLALITLVPVSGGLANVASNPLNLVSSVVLCGLSLPTLLWMKHLPSRSQAEPRSS